MIAPRSRSRLWAVLVAISILLSSIFFGTYKRTLSATLGEIEDNNRAARIFCRVLSTVLNDPNHCKNEYLDYLEEIK